MLVTASERRKIVVLSGDRRIDAAIPFDDTLGEALGGLGYVLEPGRHAVLDRTGAEARLDSLASELQDGALYSIVDLRRSAARGPEAHASEVEVRDDRGALWWLLATAAIVVAAIALIGAGTGGAFSNVIERFAGSFVLGLGAAASAVVWAMRKPRDAVSESLAMLAPLSLAFAAGVVAIDGALAAGVHLAILTGLLSAGVLATLLTATVEQLRLRSAAGTAAIVLLAIAAVWGVTLLMDWGMPAAAALSAGAVPLALRFLPSTLVNVSEGYHIDYKHFMSSRWTVRGVIPESPGTIAMGPVRDIVDASSARLVTGAVLLSATAAVFAPFALQRDLVASPFVAGGTIGLVATLVIALLLAARHYASPVLRWAPRAAAAIIVLASAVVFSTLSGAVAILVTAVALLAVGVAAAIILVPIGRGARSLVWSRLADVFEWLAVVLSFPSALLAADVLTVLRGMMSS